MRILLADEDGDFTQVMSYALTRHGYRTSTAYDGAQALRRWLAEAPDLLILGLAMPEADGLTVCSRIRAQSSVPVIIMGVRSDEATLIAAYEAGSDDYIVKPFSHRQLILRIEALTRRGSVAQGTHTRSPAAQLAVSDLTIDPAAFRVRKAGVLVPLTRLEFRVLQRLMHDADSLVDMQDLASFVWQSPSDGDAGMLKTHISHIRQKLAIAGGEPIE